MEKFKFIFAENEFEMAMDTYKLCLGTNYPLKFEFIKSIKKHFEKGSGSEYQKQCQIRNSIYFEEKRVDTKEWLLVEVNDKFDLNVDLKMMSRSLLCKMYESVLDGIEYCDEINTINELISDLNEIYINDKTRMTNDNIALYASIQNLNHKNILKLLEVNIEKDNINANGYDLNFEELIIFQMDVVEKIAASNFNNRILSILDLPILTKRIFKRIESIKNMYIIVVTNQISSKITIDQNNICFFNNSITDFSNEVQIYNNLLMELPFNLEDEQLISEIQHLIFNEKTDKTEIILKKL